MLIFFLLVVYFNLWFILFFVFYITELIHLFLFSGDLLNFLLGLLDLLLRHGLLVDVDLAFHLGIQTHVEASVSVLVALGLSLPLNLLLDLLHLLADFRVGNEGLVTDQVRLDHLLLVVLGVLHSTLPEAAFSVGADLVQTLHGLHGVDPDVSVVSYGSVLGLFELVDGVHDQFLAVGLSEGLGPTHLSGVPLCLEVFVALRPAESEHLFIEGYG